MRSITFISPQLYALLAPLSQSAVGGAERQFYLLGRALAQKGWRVVFVTARQKNKKADTLNIDWAEHHAIDFSYLGGNKFSFVRTVIRLFSIMKKTKTDYYVIKMPTHLLPFVCINAKIFRKKTIFWAQMDYDAIPKKRRHMKALANTLTNFGLYLCHAIIAQHQDQVVAFKKYFKREAHVINSIADCLVNESHQIAPRDIDVLWVGNASVHKQYEYVYALAEQMPEISFVVIMNNSDSSRYSLAETKANDIPNVSFKGQLSPFEAEAYFPRAKIVLNTSTVEGFPNTFLQAWINNTVVVSLRVDPNALLRKKGLGEVLFFDSKENDELQEFLKRATNVIGHLLNDDEKIAEIGSKAFDYVKEFHSPQHVVSEFLSVVDLFTQEAQSA
ncbi:glycosyltransferase family 4 protein [Candidatus Omnitrophota bacterium]